MVKGLGNFVAIDFETANFDGNSACEIGLAKVIENNIVAEHSFLIRQPTKIFIPRFIDLHRISWTDVRHAQDFSGLWEDIQRIIRSASFLCAHNASFDRRIFTSTCAHYDITPP